MESSFNRTFTPLQSGRVYIGTYDTITLYPTASISLLSDTTCEIIVYQSQNKIDTYQTVFTTTANTQFTTQLTLTAPYVYLTVRNSSVSDQTHLSMTVIYRNNQVLDYFSRVTVPSGSDYSDYLFWNNSTNAWEVGSTEIHIGKNSGLTSQGTNAISIGNVSGGLGQGTNSVAIGYGCGTGQGDNSIAIGSGAGSDTQLTNSIAIGNGAGANSQGSECIAIGTHSGWNSQHNNSIILNATGEDLNSTSTSACFIKPVRDTSLNLSSQAVLYDTTTGEVYFDSTQPPTANGFPQSQITFTPEDGITCAIPTQSLMSAQRVVDITVSAVITAGLDGSATPVLIGTTSGHFPNQTISALCVFTVDDVDGFGIFYIDTSGVITVQNILSYTSVNPVSVVLHTVYIQR